MTRGEGKRKRMRGVNAASYDIYIEDAMNAVTFAVYMLLCLVNESTICIMKLPKPKCTDCSSSIKREMDTIYANACMKEYVADEALYR